MNQYLQKCSAKITSGLRIMAANEVLNSEIASPNSVYRKFNSSKLLKEQIFFNNYHRAIKAVR